MPMGYTLICIGVVGFLYALFWSRVHGYRRYCKSKMLLHGKTVIVTGGNSGIGKETSIDLARRGARVILACRNPTLAAEAVKEVRKRSKNANVVYMHLDLSSLESVRKFAAKFLEGEERLDILVNNAGLVTGYFIRKPRQQTVEGFEMLFGVNHFGHFLLTLLLLPRLKKCSPSRIVMVSSGAHRNAQNAIDFNPKSSGGLRYPGLTGYANSKAANIMFARELARRLKGTGVTAFSLHPGVVHTNAMVKPYPKLYSFYWPILWLLCISERTGAQGSIHCAVDESITNLSGSYFENCQPHPVRTWVAEDDAMCEKLWEVSCRAVGVDVLTDKFD